MNLLQIRWNKFNKNALGIDKYNQTQLSVKHWFPINWQSNKKYFTSKKSRLKGGKTYSVRTWTYSSMVRSWYPRFLTYSRYSSGWSGLFFPWTYSETMIWPPGFNHSCKIWLNWLRGSGFKLSKNAFLQYSLHWTYKDFWVEPCLVSDVHNGVSRVHDIEVLGQERGRGCV